MKEIWKILNKIEDEFEDVDAIIVTLNAERNIMFTFYKGIRRYRTSYTKEIIDDIDSEILINELIEDIKEEIRNDKGE